MSAMETLPGYLRDIAASVSEWDAPIGARGDLFAAARIIEDINKQEPCLWKVSLDKSGYKNCETSCGQKFQSLGNESNFIYCSYCGKKIKY